MNKNIKLVYSTDPKENQACQICKELLVNCSCRPAQENVPANLMVIFKLEKSGRGGKTVTVLEGFPRNEDYLKTLTKELKSKCGVGGTYLLTDKGGVIEIQGDKRDALKKILDTKKIRFKGM